MQSVEAWYIETRMPQTGFMEPTKFHLHVAIRCVALYFISQLAHRRRLVMPLHILSSDHGSLFCRSLFCNHNPFGWHFTLLHVCEPAGVVTSPCSGAVISLLLKNSKHFAGKSVPIQLLRLLWGSGSPPRWWHLLFFVRLLLILYRLL